MSFIYAEVSFFEMWWKQISESARETVRGYGRVQWVRGESE